MPKINAPQSWVLPVDGEAHIWTALVSDLAILLPGLRLRLSPEEEQKARRFVRREDEVRYVTAHGVLRELLSQYLSLNPAELDFVTNEFGKPALAKNRGGNAVTFNMAHSGNVICYIISARCRVGVDVELIRSDLNLMELARSHFAEREVRELSGLEPVEQIQAFFRCWTRKEAYLKARGDGLSYPLDRFAVSFRPEDDPAVYWVEGEPDVRHNWSMFHLNVVAGYVGAAVIEGHASGLKYYDFTAASLAKTSSTGR